MLETTRLRLRPRVLADLEACFRMDREPGTLDWIAWPEAAGGWEDEAAHRAFVRARIEADYPDGMGYWVIARRDRPNEFLGWVLLIPADAIGPEVEIGWRLTRAARGQGVATEAARCVLDHGLVGLGLDRVIADIEPGNAASVRVARKIGMREAGPAPGAPHSLRFEARAGCRG
ncbi:MAG TPA: GNAT family N-acetyltransferase, partial [Paracoccaceae bacterium]|nr:GNAT family N-acetyltransferase [Paracoccaceae bacterium]